MKVTHPLVPLLGRLLITYIFIASGTAKVFSWDANVQYMSTRRLPAIPVLLAIATLIEVGRFYLPNNGLPGSSGRHHNVCVHDRAHPDVS